MSGAGGDQRVIRTILVVDDDPILLAALARSIPKRFTLLTASNVADAVAAITDSVVDMAVIDAFLGGEHGLDAIAQLHKQSPSTTLILASGRMTFDLAVRAARAGAHDVTVKPFSLAEIARVLEGGVAAENSNPPLLSLDQMTTEYVQRAVQECDGNLSKAARLLGIDRNTLKRYLRR
jgi:two-component system response regulator RegA